MDKIDPPRSNFFYLPNFGPKKKRSSTDPGKLVSLSDDEDAKSATNPFSDNKTQTISNNDAFSQSQSILMSERANMKSGTYIQDSDPSDMTNPLENDESMTIRASLPTHLKKKSTS